MRQQLAARVEEIHRQAFTVDGHFDLTYEVQNRRERGQRKIIETSYLEGFRQGRFDLLVSALFIPDYFLPEMGLRRALDQISHLLEEIDESPGAFRLCRSTTEAQAARQAEETAFFLSLEGAEPLRGDIQLLLIFHELGVRGLGLVWSRRNMVGDMVDHLDHLVKIAGTAHAGLGLDLCDSFQDHLNLERALPTRDVLVGHQALAELTALLLERGYSDEAIFGILGGNFLRVFTEILG